MKTKTNCTLYLENATFTDENGRNIDYLAATLDVCGENLRVTFRKEDKVLLRFLRRSMELVKE